MNFWKDHRKLQPRRNISWSDENNKIRNNCIVLRNTLKPTVSGHSRNAEIIFTYFVACRYVVSEQVVSFFFFATSCVEDILVLNVNTYLRSMYREKIA